MKKSILNKMTIAVFAIVFFTATSSFAQGDPCPNCYNALNSCLSSKGVIPDVFVTGALQDSECSTPAPITISGPPAITGCVTAYNNCVTNLGCVCYPFAIAGTMMKKVKPKGGSPTRRK